jgi:hypothetical protein
MRSISALDRAGRHLETADGLARAADVTARDRDQVRRTPARDRRRKAVTQARAGLRDLTRLYRHGLTG